MLLIDISIWINIFADKQGDYSRGLLDVIGGRDIFLTHFHQLELIQGGRNENMAAVMHFIR